MDNTQIFVSSQRIFSGLWVMLVFCSLGNEAQVIQLGSCPSSVSVVSSFNVSQVGFFKSFFFSILLSDFETKFCWIGVRRRHKLSLHEMLALLCATNDTVINHSVANCDTFSPYSCPHRNNHKELSLSRCIRLVAPHTFIIRSNWDVCVKIK